MARWEVPYVLESNICVCVFREGPLTRNAQQRLVTARTKMRFSTSSLLPVLVSLALAACSSHTADRGTVITIRKATPEEKAQSDKMMSVGSDTVTAVEQPAPVKAERNRPAEITPPPPEPPFAVQIAIVKARDACRLRSGDSLDKLVQEFNTTTPAGWELREFRTSEGWRLHLERAMFILVRRDLDNPQEWQVSFQGEEVRYLLN
ncbi:MAG: hypothetical protein HYZ08_01505 [Candidatus Kerfeldbacteria bacterium]|nr:hypothetical protein [Candidatus Kerfeldbacteria bacterium]